MLDPGEITAQACPGPSPEHIQWLDHIVYANASPVPGRNGSGSIQGYGRLAYA